MKELLMEDKAKTYDEVKPKFRVGDWAVNKLGHLWHIDSFDKKNYQVSNGDKYNYFPIFKQDEMRLWSIKDAKDGDVLFVKPTENLGKQLIIFGGIDSNGRIKYYCRFLNNKFSINGGLMGYDHKYFLPATKEQRDTLKRVMDDARYTFDFEKKELKKIEQKSA